MKKNKIKLFHKIKPALYYLLAALFLLFEMGVQSSPSVMATPMMAEIGMNTATFGSAMGCYFLSYTLMQIPVGLLFDRLSAKYLLVGATAVCTVGAYLFHFGYSAWVLALARFLTGFGSAFAFVGVLVIADQWFSAKLFCFSCWSCSSGWLPGCHAG
jgi:Arabinose efflux permease